MKCNETHNKEPGNFFVFMRDHRNISRDLKNIPAQRIARNTMEAGGWLPDISRQKAPPR